MVETPPQNLLALWGLVSELKAEVRSLASEVHRLNNVVQALRLEHDCIHIHDKKRQSPVD